MTMPDARGEAGSRYPLAAAVAWLALAGTCGLMLLGGLVTTHDAGMAVPDWPLSFGTINPPGWWDLFEVRLEHGHRLAGATVGVLTILLVAAVFFSTRRRRPDLFQQSIGASAGERFSEPGAGERRALRTAALAALGLVIFQGILGGLRVVGVSLELAIIHAIFAQIFFSFLFLLAIRLTLGPFRSTAGGKAGLSGALRLLVLALPAVLLLQLVVAAVMRHHKAGMAIVDFPLHFGRIIPPLETFPITIHFAHRALGWLIALWIFGLLVSALANPAARQARPWLWGMLGGVIFQIALGARIVTGGRPPMETSFHLLVAAFLLASGTALAWRQALFLKPLESATSPAPDGSKECPTSGHPTAGEAAPT